MLQADLGPPGAVRPRRMRVLRHVLDDAQLHVPDLPAAALRTLDGAAAEEHHLRHPSRYLRRPPAPPRLLCEPCGDLFPPGPPPRGRPRLSLVQSGLRLRRCELVHAVNGLPVSTVQQVLQVCHECTTQHRNIFFDVTKGSLLDVYL